MRTQKISRGLLFTAVLFSFTAGASARMPFLSDYGSGPSNESATVLADSSALPDTAWPDITAEEVDGNYSPENDRALRRDMRPGETPLQALDRQRRRAKTARVITGTGLLLASPVLFGIGTATAAVQTLAYSERDDSGPWLLSGAASAGLGIFMLCTKWEAERKWERFVQDRLQLSLHPSGKGAFVTLRF